MTAGSSRSTWSRLRANRAARWSLIIIALLIVAAIIGPMLVSASEFEQSDIVHFKNVPPSSQHLLGTDQYSRDVLSRLLNGARVSLSVAALAVLTSMTIGTAYGMIAGYRGGRIDAVMMRILDGCLAIPRVLLLLMILAIWSPVPLSGLILLLGLTGWFGLSRLVRAETKAARELPYIESARALGASDLRILCRHLLPNVSMPIIVNATLGVGNVIALEAGLSYLGVGTHEPHASWGAMFLDGVDYSTGNWWLVLFPGAAMVITVLAFNVLGDALRDVLDPRQLEPGRGAFSATMTAPDTTGADPIEHG